MMTGQAVKQLSLMQMGVLAAAAGGEVLAVPQHLQEPWAERVAIMVMDGGLPPEEAERLAWKGLQAPGAAP